MPKHVVVEAHLVIDDSIHNPHKVGVGAAQIVKKVLHDAYKRKDGPAQVTVSIVSQRLADIVDTVE